MASLLPANATDAERALEAATARIAEVPVPLRQLWNPDSCPAELLPWLAWALSIDAWKDYWPEQVKRERIRNAIQIQRTKGTAYSVCTVVQSFGGAVQLSEWWQQDPPGAPHTFAMWLTLNGSGGQEASAQYVDDVIAEVERTKPVRSHWSFTQGVEARGCIGFAAAARPAVYRRLQLQAV
ncbi:phage tail protein I [Microbulbifer discodermiae]|uniref:phage tail protein I n=1 Tax=Microbulbifer sp. 2201CG32-9 TaxID=3232309 RepID=UPI00345B6A5A